MPSCAVETGTYYGETTKLLASKFKQVYTIEVFWDIHSAAKSNLKSFSNIKCLFGSSHKILPSVIEEISELKEDYLLFLDAHYSGIGTGHDKEIGENKTPVLLELSCCVDYPPSVIIIDDLNYFNGKYYPHYDDIISEVKKLGDYKCDCIPGIAPKEKNSKGTNGLIYCVKQ